MPEHKRILTPSRLLGGWLILMVVLTPLFMFISNVGASGGEQKPFTTLATMILVTILGTAIISVLTPFFFREWFRKNLWFTIFIIITIIPISIFIWQFYFENQYNSEETTIKIDGSEIDSKIEYYDNDNKKVRSISFWKNGKRDSIWTTYSLDGKVIKMKKYNDGKLLSE